MKDNIVKTLSEVPMGTDNVMLCYDAGIEITNLWILLGSLLPKLEAQRNVDWSYYINNIRALIPADVLADIKAQVEQSERMQSELNAREQS